MILDGHIHIDIGEVNKTDFEAKLSNSGISGGVLLSIVPNNFFVGSPFFSTVERLDNLLLWAGDNPNLYPFFFIDPTEKDALEQVNLANTMGVKGFKVICNKFYPGDERAVKVYKAIARINKPILFHSGILWDGQESSKYNRPSEFEVLLNIEGLRFALAHISWPWCDECIAVYGKFQQVLSTRKDLSVEMFIDLTPGTPPIYREDALTKLFTVGYKLDDNIFFGTDCITNDFNCDTAKDWIERDSKIYSKLDLKKDIVEKIYFKNLKRFIDGK